MSDKPLLDITVVTAAHPARLRNGMLEQAMQSVWEQTMPPSAVSVAVDWDREGAAATRHRALMAARTEWVAILDSDDMFLPKHLEWLSRHQIETGADYVYSWFKVLRHLPTGHTQILEEDPIFPVTHYLNPFDPNDPIETTSTILVRTDLAQEVGYKALDRGHDINSGEDRRFTLLCIEKGAHISHLVRKSWLYRHHQLLNGKPGNSSGLSGKGDAAL